MLEHDPQADAAYISLAVHRPPGFAVRQVVLDDLVPDAEVVFDFDADGRICGIEFIGASHCLRADVLDQAPGPGATPDVNGGPGSP